MRRAASGLAYLGILGALACSPPVVEEPAPVVSLGLTLHLERTGILQTQEGYERLREDLSDLAPVVEEYGARMTIEARDTADAFLLYEDDPTDNVLAELRSRGHGVGYHADLGFAEDLTQTTFTEQLATGRSAFDQVGLPVQHVSGICSALDWVSAAADAGFVFTTGQVAYCLRSLPEADQPAWVQDCDAPWDCHQPYPETVEERLEPWQVLDGASWTTPLPLGDGRITVVHSGGLLACLAEDAETDGSNTVCEFDGADILQYREDLDRAIEAAIPDGVNTFVVVWSMGDAPDETWLRTWLSVVDEYVSEGRAVWRTAGETHLRFRVRHGMDPS